jgi:hypothetical protein
MTIWPFDAIVWPNTADGRIVRVTDRGNARKAPVVAAQRMFRDNHAGSHQWDLGHDPPLWVDNASRPMPT